MNGVVNFDDYVLIDLAFNTQAGTLRRALTLLEGTDRSLEANAQPLRQVIDHWSQFGEPYARTFLASVPEPTTAVFAAFLLLRGRRRHR
jgi:hypothetical protein